MAKKTQDSESGQFAAFEPTPEERIIVSVLAAEGVTHLAICRHIRRPGAKASELEPISPKTLRKYFRRELTEGRSIADSEIVHANYKLMRAGNPQVTMFLAKSRLGWREVQEVHMRESYGDLVKEAHEKAAERRQAEKAKLTLLQGGKPEGEKAA
jgi:hypothetical protein